MESCVLCLEINKHFVGSIQINSGQWQEYQITELIEKHFWPLDSLQTSLSSGLCLLCWEELNSFHKFYVRVEEAHINFGRPTKLGDTTQISEKPTCTDNEDEKNCSVYSLLEPEILIDKPPEPEDGSFINIPIEDTTISIETGNTLSNKDPLKKRYKLRNTSSKIKRKPKSKCTNKSISKVAKGEVEEIKKESHENYSGDNDKDIEDNIKQNDHSDSDNDNDDSIKQEVHSDSDNNSNTKDNPIENEKQKTYYTPRTNRKEHDQFIAKHFKDIVCDLCKISFENFPALRQHFSVTHKQKGYVICCNKKFFNRTRLVDHIHTHLNPDHFKCKECDRVMSDRLHFESHMLRFHGATELKKKHCDVCQKPFIDGYSLRIHKLTHMPENAKKFPCEECDKFFATAYLLKRHKKTVHLREFIKICYVCGKSIASSADYKNHMNKHEGIPPPDISCDICGLRLTSERGLKLHKENQHPVGGKQECPCPICPKVSPTVMALKKHIYLMHEKGYDHKCTICEKAFKRSDALKEHMALHTGTALYTCPWCPKTFNSNGNMHAHRKRVHPKEWVAAKLNKYSVILPQSLESSSN